MPMHDHEATDQDMPPKEYWEARYGEREHIWTGRVNAHLAEVVADFTPGRALDLGCGEGGDAIWLAERGWQVKAVDISETAMRRAVDEARTRGVLDRIVFEQHDLSDSFPDGTYDLISAQFLHSMVRLERPQILLAAAKAVAPGGHLVIVDHGGMPPWATRVPHDHPFLDADTVLADLDLPSAEWDRIRVEAVDRTATGPDGEVASLKDNVMVLRRRA